MNPKESLAEDVSVGARIRLARMTAGVSQEALAEKIGVTFQQVQKYEKGTNRVSASRLVYIARALGYEVTFFFKDIAFHGDPASDPISKFVERPQAALLISEAVSLSPTDFARLVEIAGVLNRLPSSNARGA